MSLDPKRWTRTISQSLLLPSLALLACLQACRQEEVCEGRRVGGVVCIPDGILSGHDGEASEPAAPPEAPPEEPAEPVDAAEPEVPAEPAPEEPVAEAPDAGPDAEEPPPPETAEPAEPEPEPEPEPAEDPALAACVADVNDTVPDACKACLCATAECRPSVVESACDATCWSLLSCIDANCPDYEQIMDTACVLTNCAAYVGGASGAEGAAGCATDCADACR